MMQVQYTRRNADFQTRSAQKEAVKSAPAPVKDQKPSDVDVKWQPGQFPSATTCKHETAHD